MFVRHFGSRVVLASEKVKFLPWHAFFLGCLLIHVFLKVLGSCFGNLCIQPIFHFEDAPGVSGLTPK